MRTRIITTVLVLLAAASSYAETGAPIHTGGVQAGGAPVAPVLSPADQEKLRLFRLTGACTPSRGTDALANPAVPKSAALPSSRPY